jgi:hypothetical protein
VLSLDIDNHRNRIASLSYKTEICKHWLFNQTCKYGRKCKFAHGSIDLIKRIKPQVNNFKTKKCLMYFQHG